MSNKKVQSLNRKILQENYDSLFYKRLQQINKKPFGHSLGDIWLLRYTNIVGWSSWFCEMSAMVTNSVKGHTHWETMLTRD